jgi:DNA-binding XRE family transcriptional regulator
MLISAEQLRIARRSVDTSQTALAQESGISRQTINCIEGGFEYKSQTMRALQQTLEAKGAIFAADGSVAVRMVWEEPRMRDPQVRAGVLQILNASRKAKGQAPLVDDGDSE